jgi:hypothetical protein
MKLGTSRGIQKIGAFKEIGGRLHSYLSKN